MAKKRIVSSVYRVQPGDCLFAIAQVVCAPAFQPSRADEQIQPGGIGQLVALFLWLRCFDSLGRESHGIALFRTMRDTINRAWL